MRRSVILGLLVSVSVLAGFLVYVVDQPTEAPLIEIERNAPEGVRGNVPQRLGEIRNDVSTLISEGHSDEYIQSALTERYGDVVLLQAPKTRSLWPLWGMSVLVLAVGGVALFRALRHYTRQPISFR